MLGLPTDPGLSDDDVRVAWRRIAAATHPDRDDGGDPAVFTAAAAAYATLRTAYGRGEAVADLAGGARGRRRRGVRGQRGVGEWRGVRGQFGVRGRDGVRGQGGVRGRDGVRDALGWGGVLALRVVAAGAVSGFAFLAAGWAPASVGLLVGALTWLIATGRHDLPRRMRQ